MTTPRFPRGPLRAAFEDLERRQRAPSLSDLMAAQPQSKRRKPGPLRAAFEDLERRQQPQRPDFPDKGSPLDGGT